MTKESRLYVAETIKHLENRSNQNTWWCVVWKSKPGDIGYLYKKGRGIVLKFRVVDLERKDERFCQMYGMQTANIEILTHLDTDAISVKEMKRNSTIQKFPAIRRNFQGKSFLVDSEISKAIDRLMYKKIGKSVKT